jgi:hypothetical protein
VTGDAARTITLNGNPTLNDWFDQSVKQAASPTFAGLTLTGWTERAIPFIGASGVLSYAANLYFSADGMLRADGLVAQSNALSLFLKSTGDGYLQVQLGSNLTVNRILSLVTGDATRIITLSGNPTLNDWFDQSVKQAATPTFAGLTLSVGSNSVVDFLTLYNVSATSAGCRMLFNNGFGNLAAIKAYQIDNGALADDGKLTFQTAANSVLGDRVTIDQVGNVGIGTIIPYAKLSIAGTVSLDHTTSNTIDMSGWSELNANYGLVGDSGYWGIRTGTAHDFNLDVYNGGAFKVALTILQSGNVGIGTATPARKLQLVTGDAETHWQFRLGTTAYYFDFGRNYTDGFLYIQGNETGYNSILLAPTSGNVGIGTTAPAAKLVVNGGLHVGENTDPGNTNLKVDGTAEVTGQTNLGTVHGTTLLIDHIGEHTGSHNIVLDNNVVISADVYTTAWTDYAATSTIVGWSGSPTKLIYYKKVGKLVFVQFEIFGTSDNAGATFTLPYDMSNVVDARFAIETIDLGVTDSTPGMGQILQGEPGKAKFYRTWAGGAFMNSGSKGIKGQFWYHTS